MIVNPVGKVSLVNEFVIKLQVLKLLFTFLSFRINLRGSPDQSQIWASFRTLEPIREGNFQTGFGVTPRQSPNQLLVARSELIPCKHPRTLCFAQGAAFFTKFSPMNKINHHSKVSKMKEVHPKTLKC